MIGLSLLTHSAWVLINTAIVGGFYLAAARREEHSLGKAFFGYAAYQARSGMLFPRWKVL
jgi:protein-S-isoprenylcysteine O-methyltransferase Ste14